MDNLTVFFLFEKFFVFADKVLSFFCRFYHLFVEFLKKLLKFLEIQVKIITY